MSADLTLTGFWSHAIAATLFVSLILWRLRIGIRYPAQRLMLAGFALTACWAWLSAIAPASHLPVFAETMRNLVWVGVLHSLSSDGDGERQHGVRWVYAAVAAVLGLQLVADLLPIILGAEAAGTTVTLTATILRITAAARGLFDWRGVVIALTAPLFAVGAGQQDGWKMRLSRAATFQSLSLLAICGYFAVMTILATALRGTGWDWSRAMLIMVLSAMTLAAMVILPSSKARSWAKVELAKHLFEHRYDYRPEWLRFAATLARSGAD